MNLDGKNSTRFEESGGTRTNTDLERECGGTKEGELNRVKDGLNLLPLGGNEVFLEADLLVVVVVMVVWPSLSWANTTVGIRPWSLSMVKTLWPVYSLGMAWIVWYDHYLHHLILFRNSFFTD
ncbi:hypothetical protein CsSME_00046066 [Camellia sinensis var. sinensis]